MYAIREAVKGMLRTRYMTFVSIVTILVTLTLLGILGVVTIFTHGLVNKIRGSEEINVYLEDEMPDEDMLALDASIAMMSEVKSTRILSKEDAAKEFEKMFGRELLTALDENPLPRTIVVVMAEGNRASEDLEIVASRISKVKFIESVEYGKEWMSKLDIFFLFFVAGETVLVTLSLGACMLVISNTISLTVLARKDTIDIMRLVGATDGFIRRPFYVEGMIQGLISGAVSFGILFGSYKWLHHVLPNLDAYIYMFTLPSRYAFLHQWSGLFIIPFGGLMGIIGSYLAVRRVF